MTQAEREIWDARFIERDPWLWPLARAAAQLDACLDWPLHEELDAIYAQQTQGHGVGALCFRPITPRDRGRRSSRVTNADALYDGLITLQGVVPTRTANWHDLLNALCFATWPRSKLSLHARQHRAQARRLAQGVAKLPNVRTREQDALTVFDEGGVIVVARSESARARLGAPSEPMFAARLAHEAQAGAALVVPFGHALFEHMVGRVPVPGSSARVVCVPSSADKTEELLSQVDRALEQTLLDPCSFATPREAAHLRLVAGMLPKSGS